MEIEFQAQAPAEAVAAAYAPFEEKLWPERTEALCTRPRELERTLVPREAACLDFIFRSLGMEDPGDRVPVYLVTSVPPPGA